jgi:multicopper oxidase
MHRRTLLLGGLAATMLAARPSPERPFSPATGRPDLVAVNGPEVVAAEALRPNGPLTEVTLQATASDMDLAGTLTRAWSYDGRVPGRTLRITAGHRLRVNLANRLPAETTIHWHGLAVRNDADGVPHLTQHPIAAGANYTYEFATDHPGTHWFHPHTGTQLERGLYAPLVIEDPCEPLSYDSEWVVVLDDWLDGDPDEVLAHLRGAGMQMPGGGGMPHTAMSRTEATSDLLGGPGGNVSYPYFLINGRPPADAEVYRAKPGQRVRIRFLNASADTVFRVAVGGHRMRVSHTDGFPVVPADTDAVLIGMGERYDVLVTLGDGVFPLVAQAEGKESAAFALIRTGGGEVPPTTVVPDELNGGVIGYRQLRPTEAVRLRERAPDRTIRMELTGSMATYTWGFNGKSYNHTDPVHDAYSVGSHERVRLEFVNGTDMFHPVHVHGHTFALGSASGPRKDTVIVLPGQTVPVFFDTDNPGLWMIHCHNLYHAEAGMMAVIGYKRAAGSL